MKKYIALLLCGVLLLGVTACGKTENKDKDSTATTQSTVTTTVGEGSTTAVSGTTTTGTDGTQAPNTTTTGKKPTASTTTTTAYVPGGATVPIGTKPVTTTTTTKAPTQAPTGGETTATTVTTTTKAPTTTATKPTAKPLYISLPPVGTDIDVTNKKDRIHVTAVAAWQEDDGTIGVSLTFTNHSAKWITEETDYVMFACYDKNGKVLESAKVMIGCIDTKKNKEKTFYINVPADTAEVRLIKSKIVYWTEWS